MKTNLKLILKAIFFSLAAVIVLIFTFKKIRTVFPVPMINGDKLVGFSQYFGYPFYFDTVFFFFIIFLPAMLLLFFYFCKRR